MILPQTLPIPWRLARLLENWGIYSAGLAKPLERIEITRATPALRLVALGDLVPGSDSHAFAALQPLLESADIVTCNLEAAPHSATQPVTLIGSAVRSSPGAIAVLEQMRVSVANLANNHALDYGPQALAESVALLAARGIATCGVGICECVTDQASTPPTRQASEHLSNARVALRDVRGMRVAVLGFCDDYAALDLRSGDAQPESALPQRIETALQDAREAADVVVVHLHWGYEFALHPLLRHRNLARHAIDCGADLVLCHHAHVPMGIEHWKHGAIAHGLGNAWMPTSPYLRAGHPWTDRSFAIEVGLRPRSVCEVRLHPISLRRDGRVEPMTGMQARVLLGGIARMSARLADTPLLERLENTRLAAEAILLIEAIDAAAACGPRVLAQRAASLCAPRQRALLEWLGVEIPFGAISNNRFRSRAHEALADLREAATDPGACVNTWTRLAPAVRAALPALLDRHDWRASLRARIP